MYDAIIVGARAAGSPTAMLLARTGYRVLVVDRAAFPSDTLSTHFIQPPGIEALARWGLLDALAATGCPPITKSTLDFEFTTIAPPAPPEGSPGTFCPRRTVLDKLLGDGAVAAGAELREHFSVQELVVEDGRVAGIRGRAEGGGAVTEQARIVIGADGVRSFVARAVEAPKYHERPSYTCGYYSYFSGMPLEGIEIYFREGRVLFAFPTHDNLACLAMEWRKDEFEALRSDIEGSFYRTFDGVPAIGERARAAKREERWNGTADLPNFFRKPYGPGWALVGDAGFHKDPLLGWGISDAFRDAELLAGALDDAWSGRSSEDAALAGYEERRNAAAGPVYELTCHLARLHKPSPQVLQAFAGGAATRA